MHPERQAIEQLIRNQLAQYPEMVALRMLTKEFSRHRDLSVGEQQELRALLDTEVAAYSANPCPVSTAVPAAQPAPVASAACPLDAARIADIVAGAMHATTDGTEARFQVLTQRARSLYQHALAQSGTTTTSERAQLDAAFDRCVETHRSAMVRKLAP